MIVGIVCVIVIFFFKQKTAYEMRISDWSSYVCSSDLPDHDTLSHFRRRFGAQFAAIFVQVLQVARENQLSRFGTVSLDGTKIHANASRHSALRSEEHTSELQSLMRTSYAVFCLKTKMYRLNITTCMSSDSLSTR